METAGQTWTVYLLKCADNTLYCGITKNVEKRIRQHNGELPGGARYTRGRGPVSLAGALVCDSMGAALRMECAVKGMTPKAKLRFFQVRDNAGI